MSIIRKVIYSCKFGGVRYLIYKIFDKINGSKNADELRYKIISGADESQYPTLLKKALWGIYRRKAALGGSCDV